MISTTTKRASLVAGVLIATSVVLGACVAPDAGAARPGGQVAPAPRDDWRVDDARAAAPTVRDRNYLDAAKNGLASGQSSGVSDRGVMLPGGKGLR